jgi:hypothetical protein
MALFVSSMFEDHGGSGVAHVRALDVCVGVPFD